MDPISATIMGGAMLAGGGMSLAGASASNKAQRGFAREMFKKQVKLDNTAVQRRAQDLRDAGMNPLLAASGGMAAGTPSASTGRFDNEGEGAADLFAKTPELLMAAERVRSQVGQTDAQTDLIEEQQRYIEEQAKGLKIQNELHQKTLDWYKDHPQLAPDVNSGIHTTTGAIGLGETLGKYLYDIVDFFSGKK